METTRRAFIGGLGLLIAAPTIVRASNLMPIKPLRYSMIYVGGTPPLGATTAATIEEALRMAGRTVSIMVGEGHHERLTAPIVARAGQSITLKGASSHWPEIFAPKGKPIAQIGDGGVIYANHFLFRSHPETISQPCLLYAA